jgi:DNA-binding transcriptional ArsR family regulator
MLLKKGRCGVTELHTRTKSEQSIMSQHLKVLKNANLVFTEREEKRIYYSVNKPVLAIILAHVRGMASL